MTTFCGGTYDADENAFRALLEILETFRVELLHR